MSDPTPCSTEDCPGSITPEGSCDVCGAPEAAGDKDELAARLACPDGNCIGVAGPDGHCTECGTYIGAPDQAGDSDDDDERLPCPEGDCIGVIGADGRCSECGAEGPNGVTDPGDSEAWDADDRAEWDNEIDDEEERVPCPDGGCIGIIEADGRCSECGRELGPDE